MEMMLTVLWETMALRSRVTAFETTAPGPSRRRTIHALVGRFGMETVIRRSVGLFLEARAVGRPERVERDVRKHRRSRAVGCQVIGGAHVAPTPCALTAQEGASRLRRTILNV